MNRLSLSILRGALLCATLGLPGCTSALEADPSVQVVAEAAAWTWFTDERAIVADSALYVGHVDTAGAVGITTYRLGASPEGRHDTTASGRYQPYRGEREEEGWAWTQMTDTPAADNLRPFVPRRAQGPPTVLWMRGEYASYTDYDTNIVGLIR